MKSFSLLSRKEEAAKMRAQEAVRMGIHNPVDSGPAANAPLFGPPIQVSELLIVSSVRIDYLKEVSNL